MAIAAKRHAFNQVAAPFDTTCRRFGGRIGKAAKKLYESVVYEGAGHGFMRSGEEPGARDANREAKNTAWKRWLELLKKI